MGKDFGSRSFFLRGMLMAYEKPEGVLVGEKGGLSKQLAEWGADTMDGPEFDSGREIFGVIQRFH